MPFSLKSLLLPALVLAGTADLHGERPLIIPSRDAALKEGAYNNDAIQPWVLTVRDGKAWITDPKGRVTWKVGRETALPRDYECDDTRLELNLNGTLALVETVANIYSGDRRKWERWRLASPANGIKAVLFRDDGQLAFATR
jgi:hypothetical protein